MSQSAAQIAKTVEEHGAGYNRLFLRQRLLILRDENETLWCDYVLPAVYHVQSIVNESTVLNNAMAITSHLAVMGNDCEQLFGAVISHLRDGTLRSAG